MPLNTELFLKIADQIEKHPESYDQATFCGTAYCIAGHACALADATLIKAQDDYESKHNYSTAISSTAKELLGLNYDRSAWLFDADWVPRFGETVPQALRRLSTEDGWKNEIRYYDDYDDGYYDDDEG